MKFDLKASSISASFVMLLMLLTIGVNWKFFQTFWQLQIIGGWDGTSHAAIGEYYSRYIFPKTWGWIPYWFNGMPFPQFYPPLFYFLLALLAKFLPLSYTTLLKGMLTGLTLSLPVLLSWITYRYTCNRYAAFAAGLTTVFNLSFDSYGDKFGIALGGTFRDGLFTQLLGFICLLLWFNLLLQVESSQRARYGSGILLFCTLLSNVHIVPVAATLWSTTAIFRGSRLIRNFNQKDVMPWGRLYVGLWVLPCLCAAFWYLPMLCHFEYVATMALASPNMQLVLRLWMGYLGMIGIASLMSIVKKDHIIQIIVAACLGILTVSGIQSKNWLPSLPLQPFRFLAVFYFLSPILIGYVIGNLTAWFTRSSLKILACGIMLLPIAGNLYQHKISYFGFYHDYEREQIKQIIQYMQGKLEATNVEVYTPYAQPSHFVLNALLGKNGVHTSYIVFREAAIGSIFQTPLRNSLSHDKEAWGIDTFLAYDGEFLSQDIDKHLDRAKFMGMKYFLAASPAMVKMFINHPRTELLRDFGVWKLFQLRESVAWAEVLHYEPVAFFGDVNFKKRNVFDYDFVRFQEELFFQGIFDPLLVRPVNPYLDMSSDWHRFKLAIIADYRYRSLEQAYANLEAYSRSHPLLCIASDDPLFTRLLQLDASHQIYSFPHLTDQQEDLQPLRTQLKSIFDLIERLKVPIAGAQNQHVQKVNITNNQIEVVLSRQTEQELPILIKVNYFPAWRRSDENAPLYMATPTFILSYTRQDMTLTFVPDYPTIIGFIISGLTFLFIIYRYLTFRVRLLI